VMSSQPTTQPQKYETILSPYPPSNTTTLGSSQPLGFTHPGHQPQSGQPPFFGAPGVLTNGQQGQGHIQVVSPATRAATTNFREQAKILGFIATGALSILASKQFSPILIKSSLGMNIVSTISVFIGVTLLLLDASLNGILNQDYWLSGRGISAMLIIFSVLEFCINCTIARFANQAITKTNKPVLVIPNVFAISASARPRSDGHLAYAT
uniref:Membrane spanning 4-domains A12 n=1 Tax=Suricata suricatta TaxID=37032 RepID=A0A673U623_SURSU